MARGHIRERGDGSWEVRIAGGRNDRGKRRTITKTVRGNKDDANKKLTEMLRERDTGSAIDPSKTTLGQYLDQWLADLRVEPKTKERYAGLVEHQVRPWLGTVVLQELSNQAVKSWHTTLRTKGAVKGKNKGGPLSDRSVLHAHRVLATALGEAQRIKLIASNPAAEIKQPKVQTAKKMQILKDGQPREVLKKLAGHDLHPIVHLALASGMRRGELLALAWACVDLNKATVRVERSLEQTKAGGLRLKQPKTKAGTRTITIPASTVQVLREHRVRQLELRMKLGLGKEPTGSLVFPELDGSPMDPDKLSKAWKRACKALDLPAIDFHGLRHTSASALIAAREDIVKVSRRLGHGSPAITLSVYAHLFEQDDASAAVAIAGVLG
jgi:integrase